MTTDSEIILSEKIFRRNFEITKYSSDCYTCCIFGIKNALKCYLRKSFRTEVEARAFFESWKEMKNEKESISKARAAARKRERESFSEVIDGTIYCGSYGYDMTIYNFYLVLSHTRKTAMITEIKKEVIGGDAFHPIVVPVKSSFYDGERIVFDKKSFIGNPQKVRLYNEDGNAGFKVGHIYAREWDGNSKLENHLD